MVGQTQFCSFFECLVINIMSVILIIIIQSHMLRVDLNQRIQEYTVLECILFSHVCLIGLKAGSSALQIMTTMVCCLQQYKPDIRGQSPSSLWEKFMYTKASSDSGDFSGISGDLKGLFLPLLKSLILIVIQSYADLCVQETEIFLTTYSTYSNNQRHKWLFNVEVRMFFLFFRSNASAFSKVRVVHPQIKLQCSILTARDFFSLCMAVKNLHPHLITTF